MVKAVVPRWHGDNYQARVFWINALNLLAPETCVAEVTFEADGPKAFDDVVVKYDPPVARGGPARIAAEYHQVKWHVESGGRFGFRDLADPIFIGAQQFSLLERLKEARAKVIEPAQFSFITVYRIADNDPLGPLISKNDHSLLVEKLFDGTTDRSTTGKVRKYWREHLNLASDDELKAIVTGLRILDGHLSLEELKTQINFRARSVGLIACSSADSDFRYDELARQLKVRNLSSFSRTGFQKLCRDESLLAPTVPEAPQLHTIAIRSFLGPAADVNGAGPEHTLLLTAQFRERYLREDSSWQLEIRPLVETFLRNEARESAHLRLILDAHASIAFLAGRVLDLKSAVQVELVQKGRVGARVWKADDALSAQIDRLTLRSESIGTGLEIAVAISISQRTEAQVRAYVAARLPQAGMLVQFEPPSGPGQQVVAGGRHAAMLAEQIANTIRDLKAVSPNSLVHIFAACPNALLFYLGQQHQSIAPCIVYEFDFDRRGDKTYHPSFTLT